MTAAHEVIVVGLGAWGAAAAHDLARSGHRVLGIDQYAHPHPHGSSHSSTRVYREADTGGSIYVPFAVEALPAFRQLEAERGVWFAAPAEPPPHDLPIYLAPADPPAENVYVIPDVIGEGIKATMHRGGVRGHRTELADEPDPTDVDDVRESLRPISPAVAAQPVVKSLICRYTNSPDLHWILGRHPEFENVIVIGCDGGRGIKFVPFIGRAATALVRGESRPDLAPFDPRRFEEAVATRTRF